jgi:acetyltransferase-like isoleucine patch superfamily enzyme
MKRFAQKIAARLVSFFDRQRQFSEFHDLVARGLLVIGRHTYGLPKIWMYRGSECKVVIGDFCSFAPGVEIIAGGVHPTNWVSTYPFRINWGMPGALRDGMPSSHGDIIIGSDVWIGTGAMILSGVKIGHGAIVAARAVVTKDVAPYAIVAGVPARNLCMRFSQEVINQLLHVQWWNWPEDQIRAAVPLLSSNLVKEFLTKCANTEQE